MRLFSAVLLSVGTALIIGALGSLTFVSAIPPWFLAISIPCAFFFGLYFAKYEEDIVLLPFAAAGALFSFGSGVTTGVGIIVLVFALARFLKIKENSKIPDRHTPPVWLAWRAASAVCVLVPYGLTRLSSTVVSVVCGSLALLTGILLFHLQLKKAEKQ